MRIQFCGADRTVTGSCHMLEINGLRVLLDFGMYQGPRDQAAKFNSFLPDDAQRADAVILSHGHLDHCGKLPVLTRNGYRGPIYCTPATAEVARIVMADSAKIQEEDAEYLNRRSRRPGEEEVKPLYTSSDAAAVLKLWKKVNYGESTELGKGVRFTFFDAGHILGSAYVVVEFDEDGKHRRLLFTADVGRYNTPIIRDPVPPPGDVDWVITESTYGDKSHGPIDQVGPQLLDAVQTTLRNHGRLLVPAFAVGRTQVMLWYIQRFIQEKKIPPIPVFVDSPMGVEASHVHEQFRQMYDQETLNAIGSGGLFDSSKVTFASSTQESKNINAFQGSCVIIASSPTCEFGRILHHLQQSVERANDMVVFCGFVPPNTLGRRLQERAQRVRIFDRFYEVKCAVRTIHGLSAHADGDELLKFLQPAIAEKTSAYVVHGEEDQAEGFAARLLKAGMGRVMVPALETSVITTATGWTGARKVRAGDVTSDGD